jgi:hypothetical protein
MLDPEVCDISQVTAWGYTNVLLVLSLYVSLRYYSECVISHWYCKKLCTPL